MQQIPQRLVLGTDALELIRGKLRRVAQELDVCEEITVNTGFPAMAQS